MSGSSSRRVDENHTLDELKIFYLGGTFSSVVFFPGASGRGADGEEPAKKISAAHYSLTGKRPGVISSLLTSFLRD